MGYTQEGLCWFCGRECAAEAYCTGCKYWVCEFCGLFSPLEPHAVGAHLVGGVRARIKENKVRCKRCGQVIQSFYRHDFVTCSCGAVSVDGGLDYLKRVAADFDHIEELSTYEEAEPVLPFGGW